MIFRARSMPLHVVAAVTEHGIIRAINHGGDGPARMVDEIVHYIGLFNMADTEWTGFTYTGIPYYVAQWASTWDVPGGIYLFPWVPWTAWPDKEPQTYWRDPERRRTGEGVLLHRPSGWAGDRAEEKGPRR